jgi:hypothetical protein
MNVKARLMRRYSDLENDLRFVVLWWFQGNFVDFENLSNK